MFRILSKSATRAEVLIYGDIGPSYWGDSVTATDFNATLKEIGTVAELDVRINSYGGDVFDGLSIYRQLVENSAKVNIHIDGIAASIASVIAMAGDKIIIAEAGRMMIHDALTIAIGNAEDMRATADILDQTSQQLADVYAARSGQTAAAIREKMKAETWLNGKDAVVLGLADEIAPNKTKEKQENRFDNVVQLDTTKHKFRNAPADLLPGRSALAAQVARQQVAITLSRAAASAKRA